MLILSPLKRYGKSMSDVLGVKKNLFEENDKLLNEERKIYELYRMQKKRTHCKVCNHEMPSVKYFASHGTDYFMCTCCGHINGAYEDGTEFAKTMYESGLFGDFYREPDSLKYLNRMDSIYTPKVKFLIDSLRTTPPPPPLLAEA